MHNCKWFKVLLFFYSQIFPFVCECKCVKLKKKSFHSNSHVIFVWNSRFVQKSRLQTWTERSHLVIGDRIKWIVYVKAKHFNSEAFADIYIFIWFKRSKNNQITVATQHIGFMPTEMEMVMDIAWLSSIVKMFAYQSINEQSEHSKKKVFYWSSWVHVVWILRIKWDWMKKKTI